MRKRLQASPRRVGYASVRSALAGVAETGGICKRAKHLAGVAEKRVY